MLCRMRELIVLQERRTTFSWIGLTSFQSMQLYNNCLHSWVGNALIINWDTGILIHVIFTCLDTGVCVCFDLTLRVSAIYFVITN